VIDLPTDFPLALGRLAWLVGHWSGQGVGGYPTIDDFGFEQEIDVTNDGRPFLGWTSRSWVLDDDGHRVRPAATESGFWRLAHPLDPGQQPDPGVDLEVDLLLTHPTGFVEIWTGHAEPARVSLHTDVVARTPSAKEYNAGQRMYGLVEGNLLWAYDMAAVGQPMQPHLSAQLKRRS
jgi:hypothetical protein